MKQPQATIVWLGLAAAALEVFYGGLMLLRYGKWIWFHDAAWRWFETHARF